MPTPLDRALQSRNLFFGFAGLVAIASMSTIFGGDIFPAQPEPDPKSDPATWTEDELRRWLKARGIGFDNKMTREQLIERVKANLSVSHSSNKK